MKDFSNKTLLISGASSGIGSGICRKLAQEGARLLLLGRNIEKLTQLKKELEDRYCGDALEGNGHQIISCDLADVDNIGQQIKPRLLELAPVYGFCHVAGLVKTMPLNGLKPAVIAEQVTVNTLAGIELARLVSGRNIMSSEHSSMVFISSIYAHIAEPGQIAYCASKAAVNAAVRAMAVELAPRNIRVNSVSPGFVRTEMTENHARLSEQQLQQIIAKHPLGEGRVEDVANAVSFLLMPENRWMTGSDLIIDGGYTAR